MKVTMTVNNPEDVELMLTVTMPVRDWIKLRDSLADDNNTAIDFSAHIKNAINEIYKNVYVNNGEVSRY